MKLDDQALERIIEQITRQVLVLVQEQGDGGTEGGSPLSTGNYVHRVQPVVSAAPSILWGCSCFPKTISIILRLAPMVDGPS